MGLDGRAPIQMQQQNHADPPFQWGHKGASTHSRTRRTHRSMQEGMRGDYLIFSGDLE